MYKFDIKDFLFIHSKMGASLSTNPIHQDILDGLVPRHQQVYYRKPRIISLDGNIGAGKSTLLEKIGTAFPHIKVVHEPVDTWTKLKNADNRNLLELFYEDKKRWAYTFQNAAILSRLKMLKEAVKEALPGQIIITERSVLTDRFVFAQMLKDKGEIDPLEWDLYEMWYNTFSTDLPMTGIIYITTGVSTSSDRIKKRGRGGEGSIPDAYLTDLATQHEQWISGTELPVLRISTETSVPTEHTMNQIREFLEKL
jgi:deoxycitidine kinase/deoxyguanosine kinase